MPTDGELLAMAKRLMDPPLPRIQRALADSEVPPLLRLPTPRTVAWVCYPHCTLSPREQELLARGVLVPGVRLEGSQGADYEEGELHYGPKEYAYAFRHPRTGALEIVRFVLTRNFEMDRMTLTIPLLVDADTAEAVPYASLRLDEMASMRAAGIDREHSPPDAAVSAALAERFLADLRRALGVAEDGERLLRELELRKAGASGSKRFPRSVLFDRAWRACRLALPVVPPDAIQTLGRMVWPRGISDGGLRYFAVSPKEPGEIDDDVVPSLTVVASPNGAGHVCLLRGRQHALGRAGSDLVFSPSNSMSRIHMVFTRTDDGRMTVSDSRSSGGTFVNRTRIETVTLADGDRIAAGDTMFEFREARSWND